MPYSGPDDPELPERIKKLPWEVRNRWQGAWNGAFKEYGDEGRAFAVANAAIAEAQVDTNYYLEEVAVEEAEMTRKSINDLPDSDFAYIEPGGEKDEGGKTVPRAMRHFPIHDAAHVRNALGRAPQSPFGDKAMPAIKAAAKRLKIGEFAESTHEADMAAMIARLTKENPKMPPEMVERMAKTKLGAVQETVLMGLSEAVQVGAEANGAVEVTIIRPGWSENGNYYGRDVLAQAAPMFEGVPAYVNHPTRTELRDRPGRDLRDLAGYMENVRVDSGDGSLKGTLRLLGANGDLVMPLIKEAITRKPDLVGISVNAAGKVREGVAEGRRGNLVENIRLVHSSDIVTKPAAGGRFERLVAGGDWVQEVLQGASFEQWREAHPEWAPPQEGNMTEIQEQIKQAVEAQVAPLRADLEAARRRESAREKLAKSSLPQAIHADLMEALAALDGDSQDKVIQAEVEKLKKLNLRPLVTGVGQGSAGADGDLREQVARKVLGIQKEFPRADETVWEYRERIQKSPQA